MAATSKQKGKNQSRGKRTSFSQNPPSHSHNPAQIESGPEIGSAGTYTIVKLFELRLPLPLQPLVQQLPLLRRGDALNRETIIAVSNHRGLAIETG